MVDGVTPGGQLDQAVELASGPRYSYDTTWGGSIIFGDGVRHNLHNWIDYQGPQRGCLSNENVP